MLKRLILAAALAAGFASPAFAQQNQWPGVTLYDLRGQPLGSSTNPVYVSGAGVGTVGSAGANGTVAQSIQGISGGVPVNGFVGQYNSTLPTFSSAQVGYLALDSNGRLILAPSSSISISNFPASQAVTNAGTFAVQNTAAIPAGSNTIGSLANITGTISLPTGAATSANQTSEISALGTTGDAAYAGSGSASIIAGLKGVYNATQAPLAAGTNTIGSIANISGTVSLPTGAATAANQSSEISSLATIALRAQVYAEANGAAAGASATLLGGTRDAGTSIPWTNFNAIINSNQSGTLVVQGSNDNFTTGVIISSNAITANTSTTVTVPVLFRYNRAYLVNGTTAATYSLNTSYTAN